MTDWIRALPSRLFGDDGARVFTVLDGASVPDLPQVLYNMKPEHECLYRGELTPDMAAVAPYLVSLPADSEFTKWVLEQGWGRHWGIFVSSRADLRALRQHFRAFTIVHDEDGKPMYFRFYDPRVLRTYLPTCNPQELAAVFGPVAAYFLEGEEPTAILKFRFEGGTLKQDKEELAKGA
ncbi:MAG: DUF4123 domain-containing protein [Bryobacteraceae bacterium]